MGQDGVRRERGQFRRVSADGVGIVRGPAGVDAHVAADDPARLPEPLQERPDPGLKLRIVSGSGHEYADAPHPLLRTCGKRHRRRAPKPHDEIAPLHSITSSARASTDGGTSTPSALAVLRLTTVSYLVGACTGRSAGFSPLRMRST